MKSAGGGEEREEQAAFEMRPRRTDSPGQRSRRETLGNGFTKEYSSGQKTESPKRDLRKHNTHSTESLQPGPGAQGRVPALLAKAGQRPSRGRCPGSQICTLL